jgi:hypothetical protein
MNMGDISRESANIMKDYRDTTSMLETKKSDAQTSIDRDRQLFSTGLAGMLEGTQDKATSILQQATALPQNWRQFGEQRLENLVGSGHFGGGVGGADMFEETLEQSDAIGELRSAIGLAEQASTSMRDTLLDPNFFSPEGEEV